MGYFTIPQHVTHLKGILGGDRESFCFQLLRKLEIDDWTCIECEFSGPASHINDEFYHTVKRAFKTLGLEPHQLYSIIISLMKALQDPDEDDVITVKIPLQLILSELPLKKKPIQTEDKQ